MFCVDECETPQQKQGVQQRQHFPSLIDEMPESPHNTTQYIIQVANATNDFPLNGNLHDGFFGCDTNSDSIDNHGMLGSMRGIFSFKNTCLSKDMRNEPIHGSTIEYKDHAMEIEDREGQQGRNDQVSEHTDVLSEEIAQGGFSKDHGRFQ
mmetsp:Transcript_24237/g.28220  ORF Transcript_24237/g.28220 Transcript_24237/m.28220 type:complete len:151 (+) Transcript_24237:149-601(+)